MSHAPESDKKLARRKAFEEALSSLDEMIFEGLSFSGSEPNCSFLNLGGRSFATVSSATGLDFTDDGRAVAAVDWDLDGDLDLWFQNRTGPQVRFMRNESSSARQFVAFRLEGVTSNRDAVGARLELHLPDAPVLVRSIHAGDGFLSQSSRWAHFGLGQAEAIDKLVVAWPSGLRQEFRGLSVGQRYRILEGAETAQPWKVPVRQLRLKPAVLNLSEESGHARVFMTAPAPIPVLEYEDFQGQSRAVPASGKPLLINLWASWCSPCLGELGEFQSKSANLEQEGLQILALSVDGMGDDGSSPQAARLFVEKLGLNFSTGMATPALLDKLEILNNRLMDWRRPFPVPTSFLIDRHGMLLAIYRGTVSVDQALADLEAAQTARNNGAFDGRWHNDAWFLSLSHLAEGFLDKGYFDEADRYLNMAQLSLEQTLGLEDPNYSATRNALALKLMETGQQERALAQINEALRVQPDLPRAHSSLGILLVSSGKAEEALVHFAKALEADPQNSEALSNLGVALLQAGRWEEASANLQKAVAIDPGLSKAHFALGRALVRLQRYSEAVDSHRRALEIEPDLPGAASSLAWLLATHPDAAVRNGAEALELIQKEMSAASLTTHGLLDILAAALAENGRFEEAAVMAGEAIELARQQGRAQEIASLENRKKLYEQRKPYRLIP